MRSLALAFLVLVGCSESHAIVASAPPREISGAPRITIAEDGRVYFLRSIDAFAYDDGIDLGSCFVAFDATEVTCELPAGHPLVLREIEFIRDEAVICIVARGLWLGPDGERVVDFYWSGG